MDREVITKSEVTVRENRGNGGEISRRTFLKGAGGIAAAATILGISGLKSKALAQPLPRFVSLPKETLLEMYRKMLRINKGEQRLIDEFLKNGPAECHKKGLMRAGHASLGQEATCVGVATAMKKGDYLTGSHRSHGYPLAMGLGMRPWFGEMCGRTTGSCRGHGGSLHIAAPELGILGMSGIVGAGVPIALGAAYAAKVKGSGQVAISTCGDGAMNTAGFNTSLNVAKLWNAPIVFVVDNNGWAASGRGDTQSALTKTGKDLSVRAAGFAIPGITVDGKDLFAVYSAAKYCIDRAREGEGPSLLECVCYRTEPHNEGWRNKHESLRWPYGDPAELEYGKRRDPIKRFERHVAQAGLLTEAELTSVQKRMDAEIEEALAFALDSPFPTPEEDFKYIREVMKA